ncbi:LEPR-XLL domain-containing protein [Ramlibacter terrae]|uniref:LEPR-XLL domain-containing protein n=1 Tax=Ramlibacter terrae TaxID=2732511 RepID=A0ABX6P6D3_9BURK|nr:LEPR-XLL domain-containing protein [Ramlibacter terrae]
MRAKRTSIANRLREAFRLEPLEPRVLLSADPVLGAARTVMLPDRDDDQLSVEAYDSAYRVVAQQATQSSSTVVAQILRQASQSRGMVEFAVDSAAFDLANYDDRLAFPEGAFVVQDGQVMGGSGDIALDVFNDGTISPGYSPGYQNYGTFTQSQSGTLVIEIGGTTAATQFNTGDSRYDVVDVAGLATLDGSLDLALYGTGYAPSEGDIFDIMSFGSVSGRFDTGTGFIQKDAGIWFEIDELSDGLRLTAHEIDDTTALLLDFVPSNSLDQLGLLLNNHYFTDVDPFGFSGRISVGSNMWVDGTFTVGYDGNETIANPNGGGTLEVDYWKLSIEDGTGWMGPDADDPDSWGFTLDDVDLGLLLVDVTDPASDLGWVFAEGSVGGASAVMGPLTIGVGAGGTPLAFATGRALGTVGGAPADKVLDLSGAAAIDVGGGHVFDSDGQRGEYLLLSGALQASLDGTGIGLSGEMGISIDDTAFLIAASNVTASFAAGGPEVGITDGEFGLVSSADGVAMEARGAAHLDAEDFVISAQSVRFAYNSTDKAFTGTELAFAGDYSYTFGNLPAGPNQLAVSATGVEADPGGGLSISGDFGFQRNAADNTMAVLGQNVAAQVSAGDFQLGIGDGELALLVHADGLALEASGALAASVGTAVSLSADTVVLRVNQRGTSVANQTIDAGDLTHTFSADMGANAHDPALGGAEIVIGDFLHASGDRP